MNCYILQLENSEEWLVILLVTSQTFVLSNIKCKKVENSKMKESYNFCSIVLFPVEMNAAAAAKSLQSCPTLCDPIDGSPPVSPIPGILQARTLEGVAISFYSAWESKVKVKSLSHVWLFETPWTAAHQATPSMGFSRQEYWSGVPLPFRWDE